MNPCNCNREGCRLCWLAANDPRYQKLWANRKATKQPAVKATTTGPGTELTALLKSLGLKTTAGCKCAKRARQMDAWGVAGCRERFAEIRSWLVEARGQASWLDSLRAGANIVASGLEVDPLDVETSLLSIALARAENRTA